MHFTRVLSAVSSAKSRYSFTEKTDEEMQPLSLAERAELGCTSSSTLNYFSSASQSSVSMHSVGFLAIKYFLDALSRLPSELIGIIHGFLPHVTINGILWRHALERGFLFNHLSHDDVYLKFVAHAVASAEFCKTNWDSLIELLDQVQKHSTDQIPLQIFFSLSDRIFSDMNADKIKQELSSAKVSYFIKNVYLPIGACLGLGLGAIYAAYLLFYHSGLVHEYLFKRLLFIEVGCSTALLACAFFAYALYIADSQTGYAAQLAIEDILKDLPQKKIDLSSIGLSWEHSRAMENEIIRLLENVSLEKKEELNQFLSRLPFWKVK